MPDYPDHTIPTSIVAQTITQLDVDIVAQTLSALGINITAQDLAELVIKIHAQDVGIYVIRDWATKEDENKSWTGNYAMTTSDEETLITYTIPAGKLVYLDEMDVAARATATLGGTFRLYKDAVVIWQLAANTDIAFSHVFTTPLKFTANQVMKVTKKFASGTGQASANLGGRELTV